MGWKLGGKDEQARPRCHGTAGNTTRNPRLKPKSRGSAEPRTAHRTMEGGCSHAPPRCTRWPTVTVVSRPSSGSYWYGSGMLLHHSHVLPAISRTPQGL